MYVATWPLENVYTVEEVGQSQQIAETMDVEDLHCMTLNCKFYRIKVFVFIFHSA
jgi:hypothetical protein